MIFAHLPANKLGQLQECNRIGYSAHIRSFFSRSWVGSVKGDSVIGLFSATPLDDFNLCDKVAVGGRALIEFISCLLSVGGSSNANLEFVKDE